MKFNATEGEDKVESAIESAQLDLASLRQDVECSICLKLLCEPVTLTCGHSFCRLCLSGSQQFSASCPLCRTQQPGPLPAPSLVLSALLQRLFSDEHASRLEETNAEAEYRFKEDHSSFTRSQQIPLFVLEPVLPRQRLLLHIFEPRYRALVRSAMRGQRSFGMVAHGHATAGKHGCEVSITECHPLADGRFSLTVRGARRFQLESVDHHPDGYMLGTVKWAIDNVSQATQEDRSAAVDKAQAMANEWLEMARQWERFTGQVDGILGDLGDRPGADDLEALGFWVAALINPMPGMGVAPEIRQDCLELIDSGERLTLVCSAAQDRKSVV